ncbi:hypothetical protein SLEP1_g5808 [Rubroshorea leprosula]|uniref:Uncharacterized protein n=1 Tax=Rubroshorea leprosula TaxID=152421 RepID=A0AAV5I2R9_9ROSI|nr:hypothetical protein SLEP1_g5808 [Rubroshorea leprosula]
MSYPHQPHQEHACYLPWTRPKYSRRLLQDWKPIKVHSSVLSLKSVGGEKSRFVVTDGLVPLIWVDRVHIVYMGDCPKGEFSAATLHSSILQEIGGSALSDCLLYSYQRSFNGFIVNLTEDEADILPGRIAVYKICWSDGCNDADILVAFDDAIVDGVNIISLSVGGFFPQDYVWDTIAIGLFHSMKNGMLKSNLAGDSDLWGNINTFDLKKDMYPFIYAGDALNHGVNGLNPATGCDKIIRINYSLSECCLMQLSSFLNAGLASAGAAGAIMQNFGYTDVAFNFILPAANPTAKIFKSNLEKDELAPYVSSFSSRRPNAITPNPHLSAPGVDILAAWSEATTVTGIGGDPRVVPYNIISGTSMSCPHASGATAYIKSFHPTWSPSAIKSALMTTGEGHINPAKAINPGLLYDAGEIDYIKFLCGIVYSGDKLKLKDCICWSCGVQAAKVAAANENESCTKWHQNEEGRAAPTAR